MAWFIFALLTAVFASIRDIVSKYGLKDVDEYIITWSSRFFALPIFVPILFWQEKPTLGERFLPTLVIILVIEVIANILYFRALKRSDLSLTVPMISFTPIFLLVTSPLIVDEHLSRWDGVGIGLIVIGSYVLNLKTSKQGYLAPFQALLSHQGPKIMLGVAILWSFLSTFNKVGVQNSSPTFWAAISSTILAVALSPIMLSKSWGKLEQIPNNIKILIPIGILQGLTVLCFMKSIMLTLVAHAVTVKRMSILLSALLGHLVFGEPGLQERTTGAAIMVLGVSIISLL